MTTNQTATIPSRHEVAPEELWDLSSIYGEDTAWETDAERLKEQLAAATAHRGHLGDSAAGLAQALDDVMAAQLTTERLYTYARLRFDEDTTNDAAKGRLERATKLAIATGEALAFLNPEILAIPPETLETYVNDPALTRYHHFLDDLRRQQPHVRSIEVEEVLAQQGEVMMTASEVFTALNDADLDYGQIVDDEGNEVPLTKGRYQLLMQSKDRPTRQRAYDAFTGAYAGHQHTLATLYGASVRKDNAQAKIRGYESARQAALFANNIPEAVYDTLIATVRANGPLIGRYLALRQRLLGLDQLALYDLYVPLAPEPPRRYAYPEAMATVLGGLSRLGDRYLDDLRQGFAARWVDVPETRGKRSGGYSWGVYGAPPVILLNWNSTIEHVFTLAHEAGHAMHSFYADAAQPYHDAGYPIFLAEIASTVNEVLLSWHLIETTPDDEAVAKFALYNRFSDQFFSTLIRQTMFAEFEQRIHALAEAGQPITLATLSDVYGELALAYTPGVVVDDAAKIQWSRVPHFYRAFYTYQYATGLSAAVAFATAIREEGEPAADRYRAMLAAGGSDYPLPILQRAGVDLTTAAPIQAALDEFGRTVIAMEQLIDAGKIAP